MFFINTNEPDLVIISKIIQVRNNTDMNKNRGSDKTESTPEPSQTEASLVCESATW